METTPTTLEPTAQRWGNAATLGGESNESNNRDAVVAKVARDRQNQWTQPRCGGPVLTPAIASNQFSITFTPVQFYTYVHLRSTNLLLTNWTALATTNAPSSDAAITMSTPLGPASNALTRLRVMMP